MLFRSVAASTPRVPPRGFISIGYGLVSPEGYRSSDTDTSRNLRFRAGARIGSSLELYGELVDGDELQYKPDPTQTQHTALILVGTRWTFLDAPSRGPLRGAFELYLRGGLGLGMVTRSSTLAEISTQTGLGVTVGGGYYKRVVEASGFGGDVTDDIVVTRDGTRHNLSFNAFLQVQLPLGF